MSTEVALNIVGDPPKPSASDPAPKPETPSRPWKGWTKMQALICLLKVLFFIALPFIVLFFFVFALFAWLFFGIDVTKQPSNSFNSQSNDDDKDNIYLKVTQMQNAAHKIGQDFKFARSRLVAFVLIWVILNLSIPKLRSITVLGSDLWKWTLLVAVIVCGYHIISLATSSALSVLVTCSWFKSYKTARYFAQGLRISVNLVAHSLAVLATWVFYFKTSHGLKTTSPDKNSAFHVVTWTFAMLAVAAMLWLIKNTMLLVWEANAVYSRFGDRILNAAFQLYFVEHVCSGKANKENLKIFQPKTKEAGDANKKKGRIERASYYQGASTYHVMQMTEYIMKLAAASSREDDGTTDVLDKCKLINLDGTTPKEIAAEELVKTYYLEEKDAKLLCLDLNSERQQPNSNTLLYEDFEKAMVRAHKNCLALGHTLLDAVAVVNVLDKITTSILMILAVIAWLLLADITTNNLLVLIASPFLAATFVFGDTLKMTFEGLIFSFVSHPFDVGDLCVIDDLELEVKRMGIWTTKFILIATKEEVLHPNSALATKSITNLKGEPDPSDCVELKLDNSIQPHLASLKDKITKFFKDDGGKRFEEEATMSVEEIGSCVRLTIKYTNVMSINDVTHSQCHEKKRKQRSVFLMEMAQCVNEIDKD